MFTRLNASITTETATIAGVYYIARIIEDDNPDTSYLEQEEWGDCFDRKRAFERGEFSFVGVVVAAYDPDDNETGCASLWGIETDSDPSYFCQVANELIGEVG